MITYIQILYGLVICICLNAVSADITWHQTQSGTNVNFVGGASYTADNSIQLVNAPKQVGAAWWTTQQTITKGFVARVNFTVGPNNNPPNYIALVIQGRNVSAVGATITNSGFDFVNSFAIELGINHVVMYGNNPATPPTRQQQVISGTDSEMSDDTYNGGPYSVLIRYDHVGQAIWATCSNDDNSPRINDKGIHITPELISLVNGKAWVGFTAASSASFVPIKITNFEFINNGTICESTTNCSIYASCTPSFDGLSYSCACSSGYLGNGTYCYALPGAPTLTSTNTGVDYINLTWSVPKIGTYPITSYTILCQTIINGNTVQYTVGNITSVMLSLLSPGTQYSCQVCAQDSMGNVGNWSNSVTPQTTPLQLPEPPSVNCYTTSTEAFVNWTNAGKASYDIGSYTLYFVFPNQTTLVYTKIPVNTNNNITFGNLTPKDSYSIFVAAVDIKGNIGRNGTGFCVLKPPMLPFFKSFISTPYTTQDRRAYNFTWNFVQGTYAIDHYLLTVTPFGYDQLVLVNDSSTMTTFDRFIPEVNYTCEVTAFDTAGQQSNSSGILVITVHANEIPACELCDLNAFCLFSNFNNSYLCECNEGFVGDGYLCDIDECTTYPNICGPGLNCTNILGSYNCTDIDECLIPGICQSGLYCENLNGSFICQDIDECVNPLCPPGFFCLNLYSNYSCIDVNECNYDPCGVGYTCNNKNGSYACNDIDECANESTCDPDYTCYNLPGNFNCTRIIIPPPQIHNNTQITDTIISIFFWWNGCVDVKCNYTLEISYNDVDYFIIYNGTNTSYNYTVAKDLLPSTLFFRVRANVIGGNTTSDYSNIVKIISEEDCDQDCLNGYCEGGLCQCYNDEHDYGGPSCSSYTYPVNITYNHSKPEIIITADRTVFEVDILEIAEYNASDSKISYRNYTLALLEPTNFTSYEHNSFSYFYLFDNGASLNISANLYHKATHVYFADQNLSIAANTLKLTVNVTNWSFLNIRNSLKIISKAILQNDPCGNEISDVNGTQWITVHAGFFTFFARFAQNGLVDGNPVPVTTTFDNNNLTYSAIPHFWSSAVLDPDFSVLVDTLPSDEGSCNFKRGSKVGMYVGVTMAIVGVIAIGLGGFLLRQRQKEKKAFAGIMNRAQERLSEQTISSRESL